MPIIPYSGATSLEGHFNGVRCWLALSRQKLTSSSPGPGSGRNICGYVPHGQNHRDPWLVPFLLLIPRPSDGSSVEDSDLVCQPGVRYADLNALLEEKGGTPQRYLRLLVINLPRNRYSAVLSCEHSALIVQSMVGDEEFPISLTLLRARLLVACLAQAALEVRDASSVFFPFPHPSPSANAVRYGTAKAEWFLNAVGAHTESSC